MEPVLLGGLVILALLAVLAALFVVMIQPSLFMTAMRSERDMASPWSCVTYMKVMPTWSWIVSSSRSGSS